MDDAPDKPEEAAGSTASIISLSAVPCSTGGQLILNGSGGFLAASQPLLLNGNSLISSSGTGVIINGLSLGDCQTVTLSPAAASPPLILNGAQVITKSSIGVPPQQSVSVGEQVSAMEAKASSLPAVVLNNAPVSNPPSIISLPLQTKADGGSQMDYISMPDSEGNSQTVSSSSSSLSPSSPTLSSPNSLPSLVLTQNTQESLALPASLSSAGMVISSSALPLSSQPGEYVVFATAASQLNSSSSSVVSSSSATPQVFSLPQVVPSIQGIPVSQLVQHSSGSQMSQCPQLVPVSPLTSPAPQFQAPQTVSTGSRLVQQQDPSTSLAEGATAIVSVSQLPQRMAHQLGDQTTNSSPSKIQAPQVISISSPTQVVPAPQAKGTTPQLVPLSMPQLVPVSSIQTSSTISFPQVVPAGPSLSIPSAGVPLQILTSAPAAGGVTQGPLRINQLRPIQSVGPPTSMTPGVQLLNSGIIQLPSAPPGKQQSL